MVQNGTQCRPVPADYNLLPLVFLNDLLQSREISLLYFLQAFAVRKLVGKIPPLVLREGCEIVNPSTADLSFPERISERNIQPDKIGKLPNGVNCTPEWT